MPSMLPVFSRRPFRPDCRNQKHCCNQDGNDQHDQGQTSQGDPFFSCVFERLHATLPPAQISDSVVGHQNKYILYHKYFFSQCVFTCTKSGNRGKSGSGFLLENCLSVRLDSPNRAKKQCMMQNSLRPWNWRTGWRPEDEERTRDD